jgi:PAS domain S-box-containing protein
MSKTLLLVNDDPVQLHLLESLLTQDHYRIISFLSSEQAWQWIQEGHVPDGIVLDLHMPGISGWRFCELLRRYFHSQTPPPPVLAVSATYSGSDAEQVLRDLGASAFLGLPAEPWRIRQAVARLLAHKFESKSLEVWLAGSVETHLVSLQSAFETRGWKVRPFHAGEEARMPAAESVPDVVIIDDTLADWNRQKILGWCKKRVPGAICVVLQTMSDGEPHPMVLEEGDLVLPRGCEPIEVLSLCEKVRWERVLTRVEHLLEARTSDLRESEAQFQALFEMLPDILVIYDPEGVVRHINAAGAGQLGYAPGEVIGQPLGTLLSECKMIGKECDRHYTPIAGGGGWQEIVMLGNHEIQLVTETFQRPVKFEGKPHTLLVARNLTDRKRMEMENTKLEAQLRQVQKMEAIGRLASGVAHDMNNIMTAILGHASLLKAKTDVQDGIWKVGEVIERAVHRGRELTSQLLGFARQGKHHHVSVNLHDVIREVTALLSRTMEKTIVFQTEMAAVTPWIVGDPNQIFQVVMNLSVNACDAMGKVGELRYSTANETVSPKQAAHVPGLHAGDYVVLRVTDTGEGIPQELQGKIFEPFFSTKESGKGTGMGLAMVYGIVKNHRGYIGVNSLPGAGTTMKIYLPVAPVPSPNELISKSRPVPSKGIGHILVVDDEKDVAEAAKAVLEFLGYRVTVLLSGNEAVAYCREPGEPVDLILLDMIMPDMSGAECFAQLQSIQPAVKVILCTGYDRNHAVQELLDQGVAAFIQKPYDIERLAMVCTEVAQSEVPQPKGVPSALSRESPALEWICPNSSLFPSRGR